MKKLVALMVIALMAIGIGVDDTVHFLVRFRIESSRTPDQTEALRRTFNFAGRAVVATRWRAHRRGKGCLAVFVDGKSGGKKGQRSRC